MSTRTRQLKVLRVGVIRDGKVQLERLIEAGEQVTIGEEKSATLVLNPGEMPGTPFTLFSWRDNQHHLQFDKRVRGRIRVEAEGDAKSLDGLQKDGATQIADLWSVPLPEIAKGKLRIGQTTVVFNFVPPPPVVATAGPVNFRPRFFDEDDSLFFGSLALWSVIGLMFALWIQMVEPVEKSTDAISERLVRPVVIQQEKKMEELEALNLPTDATQTQLADSKVTKPAEVEPPPERPTVEPKEKTEEQKQVERAQQVDAAKERMMQDLPFAQSASMATLIGIGTTGANGQGTISRSVTGVDDVTDAALAQARAAGVVDTSGSGSRNKGDPIGTGGVVDGGGVATGTAGNSQGGSDIAAERVKANVSIGDVVEGGEMASGYNAVVRANMSQVTYCYEVELNADPSLGGMLEVSWFIQSGAAVDIEVSSAWVPASMRKCLVSKIKRWKFQDDGPAKASFVLKKQ